MIITIIIPAASRKIKFIDLNGGKVDQKGLRCDFLPGDGGAAQKTSQADQVLGVVDDKLGGIEIIARGQNPAQGNGIGVNCPADNQLG